MSEERSRTLSSGDKQETWMDEAFDKAMSVREETFDADAFTDAPPPDREAAVQEIALRFPGGVGDCIDNARRAIDALVAAGWRSPDEVARQVAAARQEGRDDENKRARNLLALIADGRAEYATNATDEHQQVLDEEERVFRLAARVIADDSYHGLLPSWRWSDAARLAREEQ